MKYTTNEMMKICQKAFRAGFKTGNQNAFTLEDRCWDAYKAYLERSTVTYDPKDPLEQKDERAGA